MHIRNYHWILLGMVNVVLFFPASSLDARPGGSGSKPGGASRNVEAPAFTPPASPSGSQQGTGGRTPRMSEQQQKNVQKLSNDLQTLKSGSQVTEEQKKELASDLKTLAQGTTKPSDESVNQLANDLAEAMEDGSLSKKEQAQLANDINAVLNSANIPVSEVEAVIEDAQNILVSSGVSKAEAQMVANDLMAISAELQKNSQAVQQQTGAGSTPSSMAPAKGTAQQKIKERLGQVQN